MKENTRNAEIAFFGGSFTAIDRDYMESLLDATKPYINDFYGIRISTRPDFIDEEILTLLKSYKVTSIELGAQSIDDEVLKYNNRGHSAQDVIIASKLIKDYGFSLGLQMMTGLYKSDDTKDIYTANEFIRLHPDTVRIYPTIVMKNTKLGRLYESGEYIPQTLDSAVNLCSYLLKIFYENNIKVIRLGLHDTDTLKSDMLSGPYHPAFRELCESKLLLDKFLVKQKTLDKNDVIVSLNPKSISKFVGNNKKNISKINELGINLKIEKDESLSVYDLRLS